MSLGRFKLAERGSLALIGRLLSESAPHYVWYYVGAMLLLAVVAATTAGTAWIVKDLVDRIFVEQNMLMVWLIPAIFAGLTVAKGVSAYFSTVLLTQVGNGLVADIQRRLYNHMLALGVDYYNRTHSSDFVNRISHNASAARQVIDAFITSFARDLLTICGLVTVMVIQAPWMSLISLIIGPLAILGLTGLVKRVRGIAKQQFLSLGQVIATMQETAQGIRVIKGFNLEGRMRRQMSDAVEEARQRANKIGIISARATPLMETLGGFAVAGVMFWAGFAVVQFGQEPGAFMSFITALLLAYDPAKRLARAHLTIEKGLVGVRLMYDVLDLPPSLQANDNGPTLSVERGDVILDRVHFAYRDDEPLFEELNFRAEAGKVTALVGPSGGGKSTVMALIQRFYDPSGGRVLIDGQDITAVQIASLRDQLAIVGQDVMLFSGTVADNIRLGRPAATDAEVEAAARRAQAHGFIAALPCGYDSHVGENGAQLSGGQRQRIAIARAMLRDAPIVLLDEATSALDTEAERAVQQALKRLAKDRTMIVIAHRLSTVQAADKICVMAAGKIVESGRHEALLAASGEYARLYRAQFGGEAAPAGRTEALTGAAAV